MKRLILSIAVVFFSVVLFSQDTIVNTVTLYTIVNTENNAKNTIDESYKKEDMNIFGNRKDPTKISFYSSFDFYYQQLNDINLKNNQSITVGVRLGVVLNKNIVFGIWGYTNTDELYNTYVNSYLRYGGGGLLIEPRIFPKFFLHINLPMKVGFGNISYVDTNYEDLGQDSYFIFEPGVEISLNIVRYFKISGGLSYRYTDDIVLINTPSDILKGYIANFSLKIVYP